MIAMLERVCSGCGAGGMILWEALIVMVWVMLVSTFCRSARQRIRDFGGRLMIKVMKRLKRKGTEEGKMNVSWKGGQIASHPCLVALSQNA
jgi:hypothetical protein